MTSMRNLKDMDTDSILSTLGLQREHSLLWPVIGAALGGVAVGAVIALLLSPKSGRELRGEFGDYMSKKKREYEQNNLSAT